MSKLTSWQDLVRRFGISGIAIGIATLLSGVMNKASAQTLTGQHGVTSRRITINFKSLPALEAQIGITNRVRQRVVPDPTGDATTNGSGGGVFAPASSQGFVPASSGSPSPAPTVSFQALPDDNTSIPPDTHGAVGPNHVMTVLNTQVRIQDRQGNVISTVSLDTFWLQLGFVNVFDPKVLFDPYGNRWIFTAMADARVPSSATLLAVSQTSDPTGVWNLTSVDADGNNLLWADYPSLGFNKDWIVISANMYDTFDLFSQHQLYVFDKAGLYSGATPSFTRIIVTNGATMVPAITYDDTVSTLYFVEVEPLNLINSRLRISTLTGNVGAEQLTLGSGFINPGVNWRVADANPVGALPQLGSAFGIRGNDNRIQNVVYRNGSLWGTHHVFLPAAAPTHSAVQWFQVLPTGGILQFGRIEDTTGFTSYAYPSIAVNSMNDVLIGFSRFSPAQYASANYAFRSSSDPTNTMQGDYVLKEGEATYFKTFSGIRNRWGDYSSTVVDPVNDLDMWTVQEYAALPAGGFSRWGTWWGMVSASPGVRFEQRNYTVGEAAVPSFINITVLNPEGLAGSVDCSIIGGTAIAGSDYTAAPTETLTFQAGEFSNSFLVVITDNPVLNSNKTVELMLSNPQGGVFLGGLTNATLTIIDDETQNFVSAAGEFNFSAYLNDGFFYQASQFETTIFPCGREPYVILNGPERDVPGMLVTVVRTNGSSGRVLVDYETIDTGPLIPFFDYIPARGTLVFDDHQMSTNFVVQVFPSFLLGSTNAPTNGIIRMVSIALSNPRPAEQEEAPELGRQGIIRPTLGPGATSGIIIRDHVGIGFERKNWRIDEYQSANQVGGYRSFHVQIINPFGGQGGVRLRTKQYDPTPGAFGDGARGAFGFLRSVLPAGSDFAEAPYPFAFQGFQVWPQPTYFDPALTTVTNVSDYYATNVVLTFAANECRKNFELIITNDSAVEFNEEIMLILTPEPGGPVVDAAMSIASVTILFNNQPAGAVDREWNVYGLPSSDPPNNLIPGTDGVVRALAVQPDGKTILGGDFIHANAVSRPGIARMNTNGAVDISFIPGDGVNGFVTSLSLYPDTSPEFGKVLVGGGFSSYDGSQRNGIARVLSNGRVDPTFTPGNGANGTVWSVALQADGKIVVAGSFTEFNDFPRAGVARLNADGTLDFGFDPGTGADGVVYSAGISRDPLGGPDKVVLGGDFLFFNGEFTQGLVRLNSDGSFDFDFNTGGGVAGYINTIAVQADNKVIAGGSFAEVDATRRINIARFNSDGTVDETFDPGFGPDAPVLTITLDTFGKALVGGPFQTYNGTRRMGLARLRLDGTLDTSFLDTAYNQFAGLIKTFSFEDARYVAAIAQEPNGNIMIGGSFTNIGGNPSIRTPIRNHWTVFTRADKQIRANIARLIGGVTPGPGNAEFENPQYFVNENAGIASVQLQRTDGNLGGLSAQASTADRAATNAIDYAATNFFNTWRAGFMVPPDGTSAEAPMSAGQVRDVFFRIPILNDTLEEGDEMIDMSFLQPGGSITLGGEYVPLGGALGRYKAPLVIADDDTRKGIINFGSVSYATNESALTLRVDVIRTNGSVGTVFVDYFTRASTNPPQAIANVDYEVIPPLQRRITFFPGETNKTILVTLKEDNEVEADENFELVLTNALGGARMPGGLPTSIATATLTIIDTDFKPGRVNFGSASYVTNENAGFAMIQVTRQGGSEGFVSIQFATTNGTATAPADYRATNGTISWNSLEVGPKTILIPLAADGIVDNNTNRFEDFRIRLFNPIVGSVADGRLLGNRTNTLVSIEDSDAYGTLAFSRSLYEADENGGRATIVVVRKHGLAGNVSVDFAVTGGTPGVDYVPTNGTLNFLAGETSKSFDVQIIDDNNDSAGRVDLAMDLSNAVNGTLGSPSSATLGIIVDEVFSLPAGENDLTFGTNTTVNGPVYAMQLQPEGRIFVAGEFTEVNNIGRVGVARLMPGGTLDTSFDPGTGANGPIRALALQPDSKLLLGGFFTQYNGTNRPSLVRVHSDGTVDNSFNAGAGANNPVYGLALQSDDRVLVSGSFSTFNSIVRPGIVRLYTNGNVDVSFNPGAGANDAVYTVALQADGKILIGGEFTQFNGQPRGHLARLNVNGTLDLSFNPSAYLDGAVRTIHVQPDRKIVVGGSFTIANGVVQNRLARFNHDGTLDTTFLASPLAGADGVVFAVAQQIDGKLLVAGDFLTFNGVTRHRLTRLNTDGSTDPTINFGSGTDSFIACLLVQPDRRILFGGDFTTYDDLPRQRIARIHGGSVAGPGVLEFAKAEFLAQEDSTNALITVRRRQGTTGSVGVNYQTLDATALAGVHYGTTTGTASFVEGETIFTFQVPVIDNSITNEDSFLYLELINGTYTGGATFGPQPISTLVLPDDEGSVGFVSADFTVGENVASGFATISVQRRGGTNNAVAVNFATSNGTAVGFLDYIPTNGVLTFLPGQTVKNFHVRILNDSLVELHETINLILSSPTGENQLSVPTATLLVLEDDFAFGQFVFNTSPYNVAENGTNVTLTVLRTNGVTGPASISYRTSANTATAGDYGHTNGTISFLDGEAAKTIRVSIFDDLLVEAKEPSETPETFNVILFNPTGGATLGALSNAVVRILDNDTNSVIAVGSTLISETITNNVIDPGERVTFDFRIRNIGNGDTAPLTGTLLTGNGVTLPSTPQLYGVLPAGGAPVGRVFSFTASGALGDRIEARLLLTDGVGTNGFVSFFFTLGGQASRGFQNTNAITINTNVAPPAFPGMAAPYPSIITVANMGGTITKVTATLSNFTHQFPDDVDVLLISPNGERVMLMSDAGSTAASENPVVNINLTFDANAATAIPDTNRLVTGTFRPGNYLGPNQNASDFFPPPVPQPSTNSFPFTMFPYTNTALTAFNGGNPNGAWSLFVYDDVSALATGRIGGWSLSIQTTDPVSPSSGGSLADVAVIGQSTPGSVPISGLVSSTFIVTNRGPSTAEEVALIESLPASMAFVSASATAGTWTKVQNTLTWTVGTMGLGSRATLTVVTRPLTLGSHTAVASVSANQFDSNVANNSVTLVTSVAGPPALTVIRQNNVVTVSWSASSSYKLQSSDSLNPENWQDVGTAPQVINGQNVIQDNVGSPGSRYFRLRSP